MAMNIPEPVKGFFKLIGGMLALLFFVSLVRDYWLDAILDTIHRWDSRAFWHNEMTIGLGVVLIAIFAVRIHRRVRRARQKVNEIVKPE